jgi:excisionase family DNA binding protein
MNNVVSAGFQQKTASRAEAAKYLGVSLSTLARWGSNGDGPPYYVVGAKARYRLSDLDEFIETKRHESGSAC